MDRIGYREYRALGIGYREYRALGIDNPGRV
jgi:hypothetical protein